MLRYLNIFLISSLLLTTACFTKGRSALADGLETAVREKKISQKKVQSIMKEYEMLRDKDKEIAKKYVEQILVAIEMGGDSTHIDAVRRTVTGKDGKPKV